MTKIIESKKELSKIKLKKFAGIPVKQALVYLVILIIFIVGIFVLANTRRPIAQQETSKIKSERDIFNAECERYNQNNKIICLAVVAGDVSYCKKLVTLQSQINTSFFSEANMEETCYTNVNISETMAKKPEKMPDCVKFDDIGKSICLALKSGDTSNCEKIRYHVEDEILLCKALISRDPKYCELIDEQNRCPIAK